jgi:hypothetical protein
LWKTHDATSLGIVHDMAAGGAPLVPIAGTPWLFDPPLYHWLAAASAGLRYVMEFHSAARLASGALVLAAYWLIYVAARDWAGPQEDRRALLGGNAGAARIVGLIVHAHELPEAASLAALCSALAAAARGAPAARRGRVFGAGLGTPLSAAWTAPLLCSSRWLSPISRAMNGARHAASSS